MAVFASVHVLQHCIGICMQPPAVQSDQEVESTEGEDTMDQERERLRLERKAFWKDQETVRSWPVTHSMHSEACMYAHVLWSMSTLVTCSVLCIAWLC